MLPRGVGWLNMNAQSDSGGCELTNRSLRNDRLRRPGCCLCRIRKREVARAGTHLRAGPFHSYLDAVKPAIPLRAGGGEAQRIRQPRVIDGPPDALSQVI